MLQTHSFAENDVTTCPMTSFLFKEGIHDPENSSELYFNVLRIIELFPQRRCIFTKVATQALIYIHEHRGRDVCEKKQFIFNANQISLVKPLY